MILFGNRVIAAVIDEVILEYGGPLTQYDWYPYKRGKYAHKQTYRERRP